MQSSSSSDRALG